MNEQVIEKIKKLMRLAENNSSEFEAEKALLHARSLALENDLDISSLNIWDKVQTQEKIKREDIVMGKRKPIAMKFISWLIQNHFNCKIIYSGCRESAQKVVLIGKATDVEIAKYVIDFLNGEMLRRWQEYYRNNEVRLEERSSWFYGCYKGLDAKLSESANKFTTSYFDKVKQEKGDLAVTQAQESYGLMRVNDKERIAKEVTRHFPKLQHTKTRLTGKHSENSMNAGFETGKQININRAIGSGGKNNLNS